MTTFDVLGLVLIALGPAFLVASIVWLTRFRRTRLTKRSASLIFVVAAVCSIGLGYHMAMPALVFVMFIPDDRLFWLGWMAATGAVVMLVTAALVNRSHAERGHSRKRSGIAKS